MAIRHSLTLWAGSRRFARAYAASPLLSAANGLAYRCRLGGVTKSGAGHVEGLPNGEMRVLKHRASRRAMRVCVLYK